MARPKKDLWQECSCCGTTYNVQLHHVFGGTNKKNSEKYGCVEWLCAEHHTGNHGPHLNRDIDLELKIKHQQRLMDDGMDREEFIMIFGKAYC